MSPKDRYAVFTEAERRLKWRPFFYWRLRKAKIQPFQISEAINECSQVMEDQPSYETAKIALTANYSAPMASGKCGFSPLVWLQLLLFIIKVIEWRRNRSFK